MLYNESGLKMCKYFSSKLLEMLIQLLITFCESVDHIMI